VGSFFSLEDEEKVRRCHDGRACRPVEDRRDRRSTDCWLVRTYVRPPLSLLLTFSCHERSDRDAGSEFRVLQLLSGSWPDLCTVVAFLGYWLLGLSLCPIFGGLFVTVFHTDRQTPAPTSGKLPWLWSKDGLDLDWTGHDDLSAASNTN
jgi:hypothetical protein